MHMLAHPHLRTLAVLHVELGGMHRINAAHGRDTVEELLRSFAARVGRANRADDVVSRTDGDAFTCLLAGLPNRATVRHLAAKLLASVSTPLKVGALELKVRTSIGISLYPYDGLAAAALARPRVHPSGVAFFDDDATGTDLGTFTDAPPAPAAPGGCALAPAPTALSLPDRNGPPDGLAMFAALRATGGMARGDDLARLLSYLDPGDAASLSKLVAAGQVFGFEWRGTYWVPTFQFELGDLSVRRGLSGVLNELHAVFDGRELATWFCQPNAALAERLPVDVLDTDMAAVVGAARLDRFVVAG